MAQTTELNSAPLTAPQSVPQLEPQSEPAWVRESARTMVAHLVPALELRSEA